MSSRLSGFDNGLRSAAKVLRVMAAQPETVKAIKRDTEKWLLEIAQTFEDVANK